MKVGIVGAGAIVQEFLPKLVELDGIEIVGIQGVPHLMEDVRKLCDENGVLHAVDKFVD